MQLQYYIILVSVIKWKLDKLARNTGRGSMKGYCDIHSHILPGIDDGARDMDETLRMLSAAYEEGIRVIVATPHYIDGYMNASPDRLYTLIEDINMAHSGSGRKPKILPGNELLYSNDIIRALDRGYALTLRGTRYILLEFPVDASYRYIREGVTKCLYAGYIPIIAHIERYKSLHNMDELVAELIKTGAYIQINFSALKRSIHNPDRNFCSRLIKKRLVHFLGTDAHGAYSRTPSIQGAVAYLRERYGEQTVRRLLWDNPITMLKNRLI
jgi:protein-tyrosine phosphatase